MMMVATSGSQCRFGTQPVSFFSSYFPHDAADSNALLLGLPPSLGQERFQSLGVAFYRGADACVLVFDVGVYKSFENLANFPFILVGNKIDTPERAVSRPVAEKWAKANNNMPYFEASAKDGTNVEEAFRHVAKLVKPITGVEIEMGNSINPSKMSQNDSPCC